MRNKEMLYILYIWFGISMLLSCSDNTVQVGLVSTNFKTEVQDRQLCDILRRAIHTNLELYPIPQYGKKEWGMQDIAAELDNMPIHGCFFIDGTQWIWSGQYLYMWTGDNQAQVDRESNGQPRSVIYHRIHVPELENYVRLITEINGPGFTKDIYWQNYSKIFQDYHKIIRDENTYKILSSKDCDSFFDKKSDYHSSSNTKTIKNQWTSEDAFYAKAKAKKTPIPPVMFLLSDIEIMLRCKESDQIKILISSAGDAGLMLGFYHPEERWSISVLFTTNAIGCNPSFRTLYQPSRLQYIDERWWAVDKIGNRSIHYRARSYKDRFMQLRLSSDELRQYGTLSTVYIQYDVQADDKVTLRRVIDMVNYMEIHHNPKMGHIIRAAK